MEPTPTLEAQAGAQLRKARTAAGISSRALAAKLGMPHSEVCRVELGRVTSLTKYAAIAAALGCVVSFRVRRRAA